MRKKGFTLIELLAVIVILAIISVIAVPIVIHIINDAKEESGKNSVKLYIDTVEKTIVSKNYKTKYEPDECIIQETGKLKCFKDFEEYPEELDIEMNGQKPTSGTIKFENGKIVKIKYLTVGDNYYRYDDGKVYKTQKPPKEAGLYDDNYNMLASWDELTGKYHFNIQGSYPNGRYNDGVSGSMYNVINNNEELKNGTILIVKEGITYVGFYAFYGCNTLKTIILPETVSGMGWDAFVGCSSLEDINLPDSISSIGEFAFSGCKSLESIILPKELKEIDRYTFSGCSNLKNIKLQDKITNIKKSAFLNCTNLKSIIIPSSVKAIGEDTFNNCTNLSNVILSNGIESIGSGAFYLCKNLTSIIIPDSVTNIGGSAFESCISLKNITIPNSVISIGEYAFSNCADLSSITFKNIEGWYRTSDRNADSEINMDVSNPSTNAANFKNTYRGYYWKRN